MSTRRGPVSQTELTRAAVDDRPFIVGLCACAHNAVQRCPETVDFRLADHDLAGPVLPLDRVQVDAMSAVADFLQLTRAGAGDPAVGDGEMSFDAHWHSSGWMSFVTGRLVLLAIVANAALWAIRSNYGL
jgi:hypothetical protein